MGNWGGGGRKGLDCLVLVHVVKNVCSSCILEGRLSFVFYNTYQGLLVISGGITIL